MMALGEMDQMSRSSPSLAFKPCDEDLKDTERREGDGKNGLIYLVQNKSIHFLPHPDTDVVKSYHIGVRMW